MRPEMILSPLFFYALLLFLLLLGLSSVFAWQNHDKRLSRSKKEDSRNYQAHLKDLQAIWSEKEKSYSQKAGLLEQLLAEKEAELEKRLSEIAGLSEELLRSKEGLARFQAESGNKEALAKKSAELEKELALSNQMYEGLKGQYDELEEKFSQLFQQFLAEQKKQNLSAPQKL